MRIWALLGVGVAVLGAAAWYASHGHASEPRPLVLTATAQRFAVNDPAEDRIGKLRWRGTLRLTSQDPDFGGLSGLVVSADGKRFLAVTDASHWVGGTFQYTEGRLTGAQGVRIAPMLDENGQALAGKSGDAEGLDTVAPYDVDGPVYVSFEGQHRVWLYSAAGGAERNVTRALPMPDGLRDLPGNSGLEALAVLNAQTLLAIAEEPDASARYTAWLVPTDGARAAAPLAIAGKGVFATTDAKLGPDGYVYFLQRSFSRSTGLAIRVARAPAAQIAPGQLVEPEELALLGMSFVIDNFEGLSVVRGARGETLLYLVADDNFNAPAQQTLVALFEVTSPSAP